MFTHPYTSVHLLCVTSLLTRDYELKLVADEEEFREKIRENGERLLQVLETKLAAERKGHDFSVYTGNAGIALLYKHLEDCHNSDSEYLKKAFNILQPHLPAVKITTGEMSFMCGDAGTLSLGIVLASRLNFVEIRDKCLKNLELLGFPSVQEPSHHKTANEILYGRAGYLYCLLFVNAELGRAIVNKGLIKRMVILIISEGKKAGKDYLYYEWHNKCYFGAAHGILGILYMLMKSGQCDQTEADWVRKTLDWVLSLRYPSGNVPSSLLTSQSEDVLIHWCHGAPGALYAFIEAHKVFGDEKYLQAAKDCAREIWERGFLKKGYSLCHGVSGNGYGLMAMYCYTKEKRYLKQAYLMAEWCFEYGTKANRAPDRPLSLLEGLAGVVYMLTDFAATTGDREPKFPAFQL